MAWAGAFPWSLILYCIVGEVYTSALILISAYLDAFIHDTTSGGSESVILF